MAHMYNVPGIVCDVCCSSLTQCTDVPAAIVNNCQRCLRKKIAFKDMVFQL
jgi:hypothetical protein